MTLPLSRSGVGPTLSLDEPRRAGWLSLVPAAAAVLVLFAWLPALGAPYQFDDFNTPVGDPASQSLASFWHALPRTLRPLTKLTYALESSLGASSAPARRLLNAVLLGGCIALLQRLLRLVAELPAGLALLLASLWAVHPANAELVVALAGRPVLLSLCLMLASALALSHARPWLALGTAVLALLARESALPWLVACAVLAAHQQGVGPKRIALFGALALSAGTVVLFGSSGARALVASAFAAGGAYNRLGLQWAALAHGTGLLFAAPAAFTPDMEFAPTGVARLLLILATLSLYAGACFLALTKPKWRLFALLWLCLLLPTHSVVPKLDVLTARPLAASLLPICGLIACAAAPWLARAVRREAAATLLLAAAFLVLFPLARQRAALYADSIALWSDAAARTEHSVRPLVNLGTVLARQGRLREAESTFVRALERDPASGDVRLRLRAVRRAQLSENQK